MPHAELDGQSLYYEIHGEGEPLFIVMGLAGDLLAWALQIPEWADRFQVVAIENRDVGRSSYADRPYDIADMAGDALALADHLGLAEFHLLGLSMGGAIAQEIALAAPERVKTLTLVVTWGGNGRYGIESARVRNVQFERMTPEERVDNLLLATMSEEFFANPESVAWLRNLMLASPHPQKPEGFMRQLDACGRHEVRDRLGGLSMPTHVIGSAHDMLVPPWKSEELAELIPGATLTMLERAPHMVNIESAERFNDAVLGWLADR